MPDSTTQRRAEEVAALLENWLSWIHVKEHIEKLSNYREADEHPLFLVVPMNYGGLPPQFLTDDFDLPRRPPSLPPEYNRLDGLWLWSQYWKRTLFCGGGTWEWLKLQPFLMPAWVSLHPNTDRLLLVNTAARAG